MKADHKW